MLLPTTCTLEREGERKIRILKGYVSVHHKHNLTHEQLHTSASATLQNRTRYLVPLWPHYTTLSLHH